MIRRIAVIMAAGTLAGTGSRLTAHGFQSGKVTITPPWLVWDANQKTVRLTVTAGGGSANSGWNFNGYAQGDLTITVPKGATVLVDFVVEDARVPHSLGIVDVMKAAPSSGDAVHFAFDNAFSAPYVRGSPRGSKQQFQFVADRAGRFWMFCGVPPHGAGGMWDWLVVSDGVAAPRVEIVKR